MSADIWFEGTHTHCQHGGHNVTYNLTPMLKEAGFVGHRETIGWGARRYGRHLLRVYLRLVDDPSGFREMNPPNGWGDYDGLVEWTLTTAICASLQPKRTTVGGWL